MRRIASVTVSLLMVCGLAGAGVWAVLLARADQALREGTSEGIARAMQEMPQNASYAAIGALQAEYGGRDAEPLWAKVARMSPRDSASRIRLGLAAEQRGDVAVAEQRLKAAFDVDRQYETRWTLANFYFRQGRAQEFWKWIRAALEFSYGDRSPAFDLCWRMSSDAAEIQRLAIPERVEVRGANLLYTMARHPEAIRLAATGVKEKPLLLGAADLLIERGRFDDATAVWAQSGREAPRGITGSRFETQRTGQGFDWRVARVEGVTQLTLDAGRGHRIRLTGNQPGSAELLKQYAGGLTMGARYRLEVESDGDLHGFEWRVSGQPVAPGGEFTARESVVPLTLNYVRPRGEVRAEGTLDLRSVRILPLQ
jgi:tetratricopeptide (TPR) repeat protein